MKESHNINVIDKKMNIEINDNERKAQLEKFWEIFEGDIDMAVEISTMFCTYIPELFDEIEMAITMNNNVSLMKSLHRLKGSIGYLGFIDECNIVYEHEKHFKTHGLDGATERLASIKQRLFILVKLVQEEVLDKH